MKIRYATPVEWCEDCRNSANIIAKAVGEVEVLDHVRRLITLGKAPSTSTILASGMPDLVVDEHFLGRSFDLRETIASS